MRSEIELWLRAFAAAVRGRDYAAGSKLFEPDMVGFGTVAARVEGLDHLIARQWRIIWEKTRDFDFDYASVRVDGDGAGHWAWVAALWTSTLEEPSSTSSTHRAGRVTLVLRRSGPRWRAVHSHFSLAPEAPA
jgi:ketosteroid isomerase-like protein